MSSLKACRALWLLVALGADMARFATVEALFDITFSSFVVLRVTLAACWWLIVTQHEEVVGSHRNEVGDQPFQLHNYRNNSIKCVCASDLLPSRFNYPTVASADSIDHRQLYFYRCSKYRSKSCLPASIGWMVNIKVGTPIIIYQLSVFRK